MMKFEVIKALLMKEIKQIKRDASSVLVAFVLPLIILIVFGFGVSFDIENIGVDLVLQDNGKISHDLKDLYFNSKYFNVNVVHSLQESKGNMETGKTQGTIIIPDGFSEDIQKGKKTEIQIIGDGTDPNTSAYIESYASTLFVKYLGSLADIKDKGLNVISRLWFNPKAESIVFLMAGALTMILSIVGTFLTSLVVAKEWERGTMEAMIATPVSISQIIISKTVPYFGLCIISLIFSLLCGKYLFGTPFHGSIFALSLITTLFISVSLFIGLLISTAAKDQFVAAMGAVLVTFLPTIMLSGFLFEIKSMPLWLQFMTNLFPAKYYVSSIRTICMAGDVWQIILRDSAALFVMMAILFLALKKKIKKNVE